MAVTGSPVGSPVTATGTLLLVVVPSPSSPWSLAPQHCTAPVSNKAQENKLPIAI